MYALPNKTQHKLIVKVRGGISQKLDNFTSSSTSSSPSSSSLEAAKSTNETSNLSSPLAAPFRTAQLVKEPGSSRNSSLDFAGLDVPEFNYLPQPIFHSLNQHGNNKKSMAYRAQKQQYITPEHNEMIKYFQQSWKGVERDYKKSVNNFINNLDLNSSDHLSATHLKHKQLHAKKKTATTSTPLLLTGSYHHASSTTQDSASNRQDSFRPFDLEAFWGNRMFKRLTEEL